MTDHQDTTHPDGRFVLVAGTTETARIDGISAAGATPALTVHTPAADAEILTYGQPVRAPVTPVSPAGCPTPALVTRAARELLGFETLVVDGGLVEPTAAPTVDVGATGGGDIREESPVPDAETVFERARRLGQDLPDDELVVGETIPGGTTTALGVLTALGEPHAVSSSLPENPLGLKREVVDAALTASGLERGGAAGDPLRAVEQLGDPVLAAVAGLAVGATETGTPVTLAGGTQMVTVGALVRHHGSGAPLELATTQFLAADDSADIERACRHLDVTLTVTDPQFPPAEHTVFEHYSQGVAKEGAGMGGALALVDRSDVSMEQLRERLLVCYDRLLSD